MKTLCLLTIFICTLYGVMSFGTAGAMTANNTISIPPPYPNSSNLTMHYNITSPILHTPMPLLATINVTLDKTTSGPIVITGVVYKPFTSFIVTKIENPKNNLVLVSQLQPSQNGKFSLSFVPVAPLWSAKGNYTITVSSDSKELASTVFYFNGTNYRPASPPVPHVGALPLDQLRSGTRAQDVICNYDLQLVLKAEDHAPACVNSYVALRLAQIGWAAPNDTAAQQLPDPSSALQLDLSISPEIVHPKEFVAIHVSVNNTNNYPIYIEAQHKWAYQNLDSPCQKNHLGVAIFDGYYTPENITLGKNLQLFNKYDCVTTYLETGKVYEFEPKSYQVKEILCHMYFGEPCNSEGLDMNYEFDGYFDKNNARQSFGAGNYTVIGADEWDHLAIEHFTVVNSTEVYQTSVSQPITVQTNDLRGTMDDIATTTPFTELASTSSGIQIARGGCCGSYDNDSIKLDLYHGKRSDSDIIAATVDNVGKRTVHIYGISLSGLIQITNSSDTLNLAVLQSKSSISPKEDAILEPGESQTKYIVGNWTYMGKQVNGFSASAFYSYDDLENYNGMTNGYDMEIPVQWIPP